MVCDEDGCEAEIVNSKRVACVDSEYGGAVGRYAGVCDEGHLVTWDAAEGV
jgi:hypothetical protein